MIMSGRRHAATRRELLLGKIDDSDAAVSQVAGGVAELRIDLM
jgi:hypothetical protein